MKHKFSLTMTSILLLTSCNLNNNSNEKLKGFDIDLAKATCQELGLEANFQEIIWEQKETELSAKKIDLIWNGLTITNERKESLAISLPYMANTQVMIVKNSFNDTNIDSNDKYKVAFEDGSAGQDTFNNNSMFSSCTGIPLSSQATTLTEVLSGTSDIAIIDSVMANYYLKENSSYKSKLKILTDYDFDDEFYGVAGRKEDVYLIAKINEALDTLYTNETIKNIANTYGLENDLVKIEDYTKANEINDKGSWDNIVTSGKITIGYTIFAPIAFEG